MAGEGATLKDFSLRGKGDRPEIEGEMCDRLTFCSILNKSWRGGISCPRRVTLKVKPIVRQGLKQEPQSESPLKED